MYFPQTHFQAKILVFPASQSLFSSTLSRECAGVSVCSWTCVCHMCYILQGLQGLLLAIQAAGDLKSTSRLAFPSKGCILGLPRGRACLGKLFTRLGLLPPLSEVLRTGDFPCWQLARLWAVTSFPQQQSMGDDLIGSEASS